AEAASIMAITRFPTANNPILHPEKNRQVYTYTLKTMLQEGWLTEAEYEEAINQELVFTAKASTQSVVEINSWYEDQVITDVLKDLQQRYGYTETRAKWMLYNGGLRIYMCVNQEVQAAMEAQYYNPANFLKENYEEQPESAMVVMGYDGQVLGIIGAKGEKTGNLMWNCATRSKRHPGSSIKPLSAYALAMEYDLIYWSKKILDAPITLYEGETVSNWPVNYYSGYKGLITVDEALQRSTNTVPAKIVQELTPEVCFDFCYNKLKMTSLISGERRNGKYFTDIALAPLSMGSPTDGVTVLELAAAYQMFGNGGFYTEPYTYTKVTDASGQVLLENKNTATRVISEDTSAVMCKMLQRVVTGSYGTGKRASQLDVPVGAKTGTSSNYFDRWFVGFTPYYIGVVWTGYSENKEMDESLPNPSLDAWLKVMKPIHEDLEYKDFPSSEQIEKRVYCTASGLIANSSCPSTASGWYKKTSFVPYCDQH
ncbi:MAG: transglycosylase, partial [Clostridia bacterium]|nr:transglycosylase [Clostridia bacterium]